MDFGSCLLDHRRVHLKALNHGLLPPIYLSDTPETDLDDYVGSYLREEIAAEGLARNIPAFSRFLEIPGSSWSPPS
jgi:uncharacterized protein